MTLRSLCVRHALSVKPNHHPLVSHTPIPHWVEKVRSRNRSGVRAVRVLCCPLPAISLSSNPLRSRPPSNHAPLIFSDPAPAALRGPRAETAYLADSRAGRGSVSMCWAGVALGALEARTGRVSPARVPAPRTCTPARASTSRPDPTPPHPAAGPTVASVESAGSETTPTLWR